MKGKCFAALLASTLFTAAAGAALITGVINFTGSNSYDTATHVVDFINPANVSSDTIAFPTCNACATFAGPSGVFDYSAAVPAPPTKVLAFPNLIVANAGGEVFSFDLAQVADVVEVPNVAVDIDGTGTLHLTGFDPTPGTFFFSSQGPEGIEVSFSATVAAAAVPEPAGLLMICTALFGLALVQQRRRQ